VSKEDFHHLLLELLRGLLRDERREEQLRGQTQPEYAAPDQLRIPCKWVARRALCPWRWLGAVRPWRPQRLPPP
jgi:hypothetical protein